MAGETRLKYENLSIFDPLTLTFTFDKEDLQRENLPLSMIFDCQQDYNNSFNVSSSESLKNPHFERFYEFLFVLLFCILFSIIYNSHFFDNIDKLFSKHKLSKDGCSIRSVFRRKALPLLKLRPLTNADSMADSMADSNNNGSLINGSLNNGSIINGSLINVSSLYDRYGPTSLTSSDYLQDSCSPPSILLTDIDTDTNHNRNNTSDNNSYDTNAAIDSNCSDIHIYTYPVAAAEEEPSSQVPPSILARPLPPRGVMVSQIIEKIESFKGHSSTQKLNNANNTLSAYVQNNILFESSDK